jgi:hypothetical protein
MVSAIVLTAPPLIDMKPDFNRLFEGEQP